MAAFGGLTCLTFEKNGDVIVEPLNISSEDMDRLEGNILLFHTGIERSASEILSEQDEKSQKDDSGMIENLHSIKEIGLETRKLLEKGNIDAMGELLHTHWELKKKRSSNISNPFIDECYEAARKNGAIGGKIMGAGGGGFFLFYCNNSDKARVSQVMKKIGLKPMKFRFDFEGAKILVNMKGL